MHELIGRYEIKAEIGHGGFGRVYKAFDPTVGRDVAVKTLHANGDSELLVRFRNEAAAAGKLRHNNIVTIYDYGEHDGEPYIVMELLDGEDLQRAIQSQRPLTLLQKLHIMEQVAEGLDHAHQNGVVHRDVKPANMMLSPELRVKIMDFGIAFVTQRAGTRLTKTGTVPGTLKYMAPEQFRGANNDALSDIFSYGVCFYELLSGQNPFDGSTQPNVMFNIMQQEPQPLREVAPECPEPLENIVVRCLKKERELRYSSFEELLLDSKGVLADLRHERARVLITRAEELVVSENRDAAHAALREALELDPSNRNGRRLREELHRAQKQAARLRVEALVQTGRQQLDTRQFTAAISTFEAALKLDRSNQQVISLIANARAIQDQIALADKLVGEAFTALSKENLGNARQLLEKALSVNSTHLDALRLLGEVRLQISKKEEEKKAAELAEARRSRIRGLISTAAEQLNRGDASGAISELERLQAEAPDFPEIPKLLAAAQERSAARKRQEMISRLMSEVDQLVAGRYYHRAAEMLEIGLGYYPNDVTIQKRLASVKSSLSQANLVPAKPVVVAQPAPAMLVQSKCAINKYMAILVSVGIAALATIAVWSVTHDLKPAEKPPAIANGPPKASRSEPPTLSTPSPAPPAVVTNQETGQATPAVPQASKYVQPSQVAGQQIVQKLPVTSDPAATKLSPPPPGDSRPTPAQEWERLKSSTDVVALTLFAQSHEETPLASSAQERIQQLRWDALDKKNIAALRDYANAYPSSPFAASAQSEIAKLEWDGVNKNDLTALQEFKRRHPQSDLASAAIREIERLSPPPKVQAVPTVDNSKTREAEGVVAALNRFTESIGRKDLDSMTATYPGLPKGTWKQAFSRVKSISMALKPIDEPHISGNNAIVDCDQTTRTVSAGQEAIAPVRRVKVFLNRRNRAWIILRME